MMTTRKLLPKKVQKAINIEIEENIARERYNCDKAPESFSTGIHEINLGVILVFTFVE